jgi:hypothetical protein
MKKILIMLAMVTSMMLVSSVYADNLPDGWVLASSENNSLVFANKSAKASVSMNVIESEDSEMTGEEFAQETAENMNCEEDVEDTELGYQISCPTTNTFIYVNKNKEGSFNVITASSADEAGFGENIALIIFLTK